MKRVGCYACKYLEWYEADYEEVGGSGWYCNGRIDEPEATFKTFPCKRKLKCYQPKEKE